MRLFGRRREDPAPEERRQPENAERRRTIDELRAQRELGDKHLAEHRVNESEARAEKLRPRIKVLQAQARALQRRT